MSAGDHGGLLAACVQYADVQSGGDPLLWRQALEYLAAAEGDVGDSIEALLQHIERGELLPPLVVLGILAKNNNLKVRGGGRGLEFWRLGGKGGCRVGRKEGGGCGKKSMLVVLGILAKDNNLKVRSGEGVVIRR
jgi:hypothetical protein